MKALDSAEYLVTVCRRKLSLRLRHNIQQEASGMKGESVCVRVCVSERHHYFTWGHFYSNKHDLMSPKQARGAIRTLVWWRLSLQRFTRRKKRKEKLLFHCNSRENVQPFHSKSPTLELRYEPRLPLHLGCGLSLCNLWCHTVTLNGWRRWSQDTSKSHQTSTVREE